MSGREGGKKKPLKAATKAGGKPLVSGGINPINNLIDLLSGRGGKKKPMKAANKAGGKGPLVSGGINPINDLINLIKLIHSINPTTTNP